MKKNLRLLIILGLLSCNLIPSTKNKVIGKWEILKPISVNEYYSINKFDVEFTENMNLISTFGYKYLGSYAEIPTIKKFEIDGERIICRSQIFTISKDGLLTVEQTALGTTIKLKRKVSDKGEKN